MQSWWCRQDVDGTVQSAAGSDCVLLGLCVRGSSSVVKLIGGRVQSGLCCQVD